MGSTSGLIRSSGRISWQAGRAQLYTSRPILPRFSLPRYGTQLGMSKGAVTPSDRLSPHAGHREFLVARIARNPSESSESMMKHKPVNLNLAV